MANKYAPLTTTDKGPACSRCGLVINVNQDTGGRHHRASFQCDAIFNANEQMRLGRKRAEEIPTRARWLIAMLEILPVAAETRNSNNRLSKEHWVPDWVVFLGRTYPTHAQDPLYPAPRQQWFKLGDRLKKDLDLQEVLRGAYRARGARGIAHCIEIELVNSPIPEEDSLELTFEVFTEDL